ncbi:GGDEF domain-containing protein [Longispora albida]|uniref:GGDEF domain-containing protein n=1 Tax=Longispora albida TaxID=203523 RepID=UPI00036F131B|nr:GGDEF domain-containing protein [Longispora albida]
MLTAASPAGRRASWRLWLLAVGVLALTTWYLIPGGGLAARTWSCWLALAVLHGWTLSLVVRITRRTAVPGHRRLWRASAVTLALFLLGDMIQLLSLATRPLTVSTVTGVPAQSVLVVAGIAILVSGMLATPLGLTSEGERLRFWFDVGTVMAAGLAWGLYLLAEPPSDVRSATGLLGPPVLFLIELFAVTKLVFSQVPLFTRAAGTLLVASAAVETSIQAAGGPFWVDNDRLHLLLAATLVASALAAAGAEVQLSQMPAGTGLRARSSRRRFSVLPYAAIASVYVVLVLTLAGHGLDLRAWVAVAAAFCCTLLVVIRQVLAFLDNERLVRELSAEVGHRQRLAAALHHQAYHDRLTGLGNRALFAERLDEAAGDTAVVIIDLDDFKPVNDRFGHRAGDELLIAVAGRLRSCVRDTDVLARLGGDEFGVLITSPDQAVVREVAERIVTAVARPVRITGHDLVIGASVGAAIDRAGGHAAEELLHAADSAMYEAKKAGKNSARVVVLDVPSGTE